MRGCTVPWHPKCTSFQHRLAEGFATGFAAGKKMQAGQIRFFHPNLNLSSIQWSPCLFLAANYLVLSLLVPFLSPLVVPFCLSFPSPSSHSLSLQSKLKMKVIHSHSFAQADHPSSPLYLPAFVIFFLRDTTRHTKSPHRSCSCSCSSSSRTHRMSQAKRLLYPLPLALFNLQS